MEPELLQAFSNLNQQFEDIKSDIKEIKTQFKDDHDKLIKVEARQDEIIRDVDAIGEKVRNLQTTVWKISLVIAGSGAGASALFNIL